jgi:hypothetical protein
MHVSRTNPYRFTNKNTYHEIPTATGVELDLRLTLRAHSMRNLYKAWNSNAYPYYHTKHSMRIEERKIVCYAFNYISKILYRIVPEGGTSSI